MSKNKNALKDTLKDLVVDSAHAKGQITGVELPLEEIRDLIEEGINGPYDISHFKVQYYGEEDPILSVIYEGNLLALLEVGQEGATADLPAEQFIVTSLHSGCIPVLAVQLSERIREALPIPVYFDGMFFPRFSKKDQNIGLSWNEEAVQDHYISIYSMIREENSAQDEFERDTESDTRH